MKYIDAERLNAEIDRLYDGEAPKHDQQCDFDDGYFTGIGAISQVIDSLQQEQPGVDLEKEINEIWNPRFNLGWDEHSALSMNHEGFVHIARHFYELGKLNTTKEKNQ